MPTRLWHWSRFVSSPANSATSKEKLCQLGTGHGTALPTRLQHCSRFVSSLANSATTKDKPCQLGNGYGTTLPTRLRQRARFVSSLSNSATGFCRGRLKNSNLNFKPLTISESVQALPLSTRPSSPHRLPRRLLPTSWVGNVWLGNQKADSGFSRGDPPSCLFDFVLKEERQRDFATESRGRQEAERHLAILRQHCQHLDNLLQESVGLKQDNLIILNTKICTSPSMTGWSSWGPGRKNQRLQTRQMKTIRNKSTRSDWWCYRQPHSTMF